MSLLLLCSGDVEANPGPPSLRSASSDVDNEQTTAQNTAILEMLKSINERTIDLAASQGELSSDVKAIKNNQEAIKTSLSDIFTRLEALEHESKNLNTLEQEIVSIKSSTAHLTSQQETLQTRLDDLEDRSRRNNVVIHGIEDSKESWQDTEEKALAALHSVLGVEVSPSEVERAHRIGTLSSSKPRPIIMKFCSFKTRDKVLSARSKLKESGISVSEDFSPATRQARKKLSEFAKRVPGSPKYKLRYTKLFVNEKCYVYDPLTDSVTETSTYSHPQQHQQKASRGNGLNTAQIPNVETR